MTFLADLQTFWAATSGLNTTIPATSVFTTFAPPGTAFPYAVVTIISSIPDYTSGLPSIENVHFQVSIFSSTAADADTKAASIDAALNDSKINSSTGMRCLRSNFMLFQEEPLGKGGAWHAMLEYDATFNKTLAQ